MRAVILLNYAEERLNISLRITYMYALMHTHTHTQAEQNKHTKNTAFPCQDYFFFFT